MTGMHSVSHPGPDQGIAMPGRAVMDGLTARGIFARVPSGSMGASWHGGFVFLVVQPRRLRFTNRYRVETAKKHPGAATIVYLLQCIDEYIHAVLRQSLGQQHVARFQVIVVIWYFEQEAGQWVELVGCVQDQFTVLNLVAVAVSADLITTSGFDFPGRRFDFVAYGTQFLRMGRKRLITRPFAVDGWSGLLVAGWQHAAHFARKVLILYSGHQLPRVFLGGVGHQGGRLRHARDDS